MKDKAERFTHKTNVYVGVVGWGIYLAQIFQSAKKKPTENWNHCVPLAMFWL